MESMMLFGSTGQLGVDLAEAFAGDDLYKYGHQDIDLNDTKAITEEICSRAPRWIINASGYNDVVMSETQPDRAFAINARAVWAMAQAARKIGATLVHFSSDYVFSGGKKEPYMESDPPGPLNVYGVSKLAGEFLAMNCHRWCIFRISALFGLAGCRTKGGQNFVDAILQKAALGQPVRVVRDKACSPTYTKDVARRLREVLPSGQLEPGLYHLPNAGVTTWLEFAEEIIRQAGMNPRVEAIEDTGTLRRPDNSAIVSEKIEPLRPWKEALAEYLESKRG